MANGTRYGRKTKFNDDDSTVQGNFHGAVLGGETSVPTLEVYKKLILVTQPNTFVKLKSMGLPNIRLR